DAFLLEDFVAVGGEYLEREAVEPLAQFAVAVVDDDLVDGLLFAEVDFPPRIVGVFLGVGLAGGVVVGGLVAVDGPLGVAAVAGVLLAGLAAEGDVAAVALDFDFGQCESALAGELDADEAALRAFACRRRAAGGEAFGKALQQREETVVEGGAERGIGDEG